MANDVDLERRNQRAETVLLWILWGFAAFVNALYLKERIHRLLFQMGMSAADIATDKWVLFHCYVIIVSIVGIIRRWGYTIPFILLGCLVVGPFLAQPNQSGADDAIRSLYCAIMGGLIGFGWDCVYRQTRSQTTPKGNETISNQSDGEKPRGP